MYLIHWCLCNQVISQVAWPVPEVNVASLRPVHDIKSGRVSEAAIFVHPASLHSAPSVSPAPPSLIPAAVTPTGLTKATCRNAESGTATPLVPSRPEESWICSWRGRDAEKTMAAMDKSCGTQTWQISWKPGQECRWRPRLLLSEAAEYQSLNGGRIKASLCSVSSTAHGHRGQPKRTPCLWLFVNFFTVWRRNLQLQEVDCLTKITWFILKINSPQGVTLRHTFRGSTECENGVENHWKQLETDWELFLKVETSDFKWEYS